MEKIVSVVVTYNRIALLKRVIDCLRKQTHALMAMMVIDNGSTDGTHEWLDAQKDLTVIHQDNVGGSGGFYRGIKEAAQMECDWVWCMDDDVFPTPQCLETLLSYSDKISSAGILCPHRLMSGKTFVAEAKTLNLSTPLMDMHNDMLTAAEVESHPYVCIEGMSFEGPLIRKEVISKIGLPNKDLFILYDDTDYSYRAILAGYRVAVVRDAIMEKHDFQAASDYRENKIRNKWKLFYHVRNTAYFGHHYGKNVLVRYMAALPFVLKMYGAITFNFIRGHKYKLSDYAVLARAMALGVREKLGKVAPKD